MPSGARGAAVRDGVRGACLESPGRRAARTRSAHREPPAHRRDQGPRGRPDRADARRRRRGGRGQGRQRLARRRRVAPDAAVGEGAADRPGRPGDDDEVRRARLRRPGPTVAAEQPATTSRGRTPSSRRTPSSTTTSRRPTARAGRCTARRTWTTSPAGSRTTRACAQGRTPGPRRTTTSSSSSTSSRAACLTSYDVNAEADERAAQADRLTQEQATILQVTRLLNRVEVRGGAGSGKTVLALQQAKELTRGRGEREPQRVALLCYSIGLAEYLKREVAELAPQAPAGVRRHLPRARQAVGRAGRRPHGQRVLGGRAARRLMADLAEELPDGERFDAVIVDEAQDFADSWWTPLLKALRDEEEGGLYVYSDENQRIFARFGRPPVPLVPLVLDHNLRNTQQIHEAFGPLAPSRMYARGGDGPAVRFVPASPGRRARSRRRRGRRLLDDGWKPGERLPADHRPPAPGAGGADRAGHDQERLLADVLGRRRRLLRPRPRLQGTRAPRRRALRQRVRGPRPRRGRGCTSGCRAPPTSWSSSATPT